MPIYHFPILAARAYHTPFDAYSYKEFSQYVRKISLSRTYTDKNVWNEEYRDSFGVFHEEAGCGCPPYDDHALDSIINWKEGAEKPSTDLFLCGHDHMNNFVIKDKENGITFAYGTSTGIDPGNDPELNGGTVVTINSDGSFKIYHEYYKLLLKKLAPWMVATIIGASASVILLVLLLALLL